MKIRKGVGETKQWAFNIRSRILSLFGKEDIPLFKREYYMRGPLVEKDVREFGVAETTRSER